MPSCTTHVRKHFLSLGACLEKCAPSVHTCSGRLAIPGRDPVMTVTVPMPG